MYKKILVATDGSEGAMKALKAALDMAEQLKSAIHTVSVEELPQIPATVDEVVEEKRSGDRRMRAITDRARKLAALKNVVLQTHVIAGHPVAGIVKFAAEGAYDLLVVGFMGHTALYNRLIGSTADRLVELAPCDVLVIK